VDQRTRRIRDLNDHVRTTLIDCRLLITQGVQAMDDLEAILAKVCTFDSFTAANDPYGERDFGAFDHSGHTVFWKIDTYDLDLTMHSPDPSDPTVTARVLTVMLAEEY
jgi:hypothetical protein